MMKRKQRLTGVDLCRGIAIYAVVLQHSGDETWAAVGYWAKELRHFCSFAVPFFIAASFYFMTRKLYISGTQSSLMSRFQRLLIPYTFWSAFYIVSKSFNFLLFNEPAQLSRLLQDPIFLIFIGGASVQLYFLPLLFVGTFLMQSLTYLFKKLVPIKTLILLFFISLATYEIVLVSGNGFQLGPNIAFANLAELIIPEGNNNPALRLFLVATAFMIWCFPYITTAMLLNYLLTKTDLIKFNRNFTFLVLGVFIVVNGFGHLFLPISVYEILRAYSFLLIGISLSEKFQENAVITNLGLCSFGIYLIHPFFIQLLEIFLHIIYPLMTAQVSVLTLLIFSIPSFLISWFITYFLMKRKWVATFIFGV